MRSFLSIILATILVSCQAAPNDDRLLKDNKPTSAVKKAAPVSLIFNTDRNVPILTAFGNGRLKISGDCLIFETGEGSLTPIWPAATRLHDDAKSILTPNGKVYPLDSPVVLPGGNMGTAKGTDLKLSVAPIAGCPQALFGVHNN